MMLLVFALLIGFAIGFGALGLMLFSENEYIFATCSIAISYTAGRVAYTYFIMPGFI